MASPCHAHHNMRNAAMLVWGDLVDNEQSYYRNREPFCTINTFFQLIWLITQEGMIVMTWPWVHWKAETVLQPWNPSSRDSMQWFGCCIDPSGGFENHLESFCSSPLFAVSGRPKCPEHLAFRLIPARVTLQSVSVQEWRELDTSEQRYGQKTLLSKTVT